MPFMGQKRAGRRAGETRRGRRAPQGVARGGRQLAAYGRVPRKSSRCRRRDAAAHWQAEPPAAGAARAALRRGVSATVRSPVRSPNDSARPFWPLEPREGLAGGAR